jgi:hypothetical protein
MLKCICHHERNSLLFPGIWLRILGKVTVV